MVTVATVALLTQEGIVISDLRLVYVGAHYEIKRIPETETGIQMHRHKLAPSPENRQKKSPCSPFSMSVCLFV